MNCKKYSDNFLGFSLIELSIVLIIIGLLVAGVTGGASLIESAKIRALVTEITNWDKAVNSFYALTNRLPSDVDGDGIFGEGSFDEYDNYFPAPYDGSKYPVPKESVAPFVDLYLNRVIDFQPIYSNETNQDTGMPASKILKNGTNYYFINLIYTSTSNFIDYYLNNFYEGHAILLNMSEDNKYRIAFAKKIDNKIDDNSPTNGKIRVRTIYGNALRDNYDDIDQDSIISVIAYKLSM